MGLRNYCASFSTAIGRFYVEWNEESVVSLTSLRPAVALSNAEGLGIKAAQQVKEYLAGQRSHFDLPWMASGSAFQVACWQALLRIPYGSTCSYRQLACAVGNPNAARAVGQAIHVNPLMVIVPCHRVIAANGSLGGYAGGTGLKLKLLNLESRNISGREFTVSRGNEKSKTTPAV